MLFPAILLGDSAVNLRAWTVELVTKHGICVDSVDASDIVLHLPCFKFLPVFFLAIFSMTFRANIIFTCLHSKM